MPKIAELKDTHPHYFRFSNGKPFETVTASGNGMIRIRVKAGEGDYAEYEFHKTTGALSLYNSAGVLQGTSAFVPSYLDAGTRASYTLGTPAFSGTENGDLKRVSVTYPLRRSSGGGAVRGSMTIHFDVDFDGPRPLRKITATVTATDPLDDPQLTWSVTGLPDTSTNQSDQPDYYYFGGLEVSARDAAAQTLSKTVSANAIEYVFGGASNGSLVVDPTLALSVASNVFTLTSDNQYRLTTIEMAVKKAEGYWNGAYFTCGDRTGTGRGAVAWAYERADAFGNASTIGAETAPVTGLASSTIFNTDTIAAANFTCTEYDNFGGLERAFDGETRWVLWAGKPFFIMSTTLNNVDDRAGSGYQNVAQIRFALSGTAAWGTARNVTGADYESFYHGNATGEGTIGFSHFRPRTYSASTPFDFSIETVVTQLHGSATVGLGSNDAAVDGADIRMSSVVFFDPAITLTAAQAAQAKYRENADAPPTTTNSRLSITVGTVVADTTASTQNEYISGGFDYRYGAYRITANASNNVTCSLAALASYDLPFTCWIIHGYTANTAPAIKIGTTLLDNVGTHATTEYLGTLYNSYVDTVNDRAYIVIFADQTANTTVTYEFGPNLGNVHTQTSSDSMTLAESMTRFTTKSNSESLTLTEARTRVISAVRFDPANLAESIAKLANTAKSDSFSLSEAVTSVLTRGVLALETMSMSDALTTVSAFAKTISDTLSFTEARAKAIGHQIAVSLSLADVVIQNKDYTQQITDSMSMSETVTNVRSWVRTVLDTFLLVDQEWGDPLLNGAFPHSTPADTPSNPSPQSVTLSNASNVFTIENSKLKFTTQEGAVDTLQRPLGGGTYHTLGSTGCVYFEWTDTNRGTFNSHTMADNATATTNLNNGVIAKGTTTSTAYGGRAFSTSAVWTVWAGKPYVITFTKIDNADNNGAGSAFLPLGFRLGGTSAWGSEVKTTGQTTQKAYYHGDAANESSVGICYDYHRGGTYQVDMNTDCGTAGASGVVGLRDASTLNADYVLRMISMFWVSSDISSGTADATHIKFRENFIAPPTTGNSRLSFVTGSAASNSDTANTDTSILNGWDYNFYAVRGSASSNTLKVSIQALTSYAFPFTCFIITNYTSSVAPVVKRGSTILDGYTSHASATYNGTTYSSWVDDANNTAYVVVYDEQAANTTQTYEMAPTLTGVMSHNKTIRDTLFHTDSRVSSQTRTHSESLTLAESTPKVFVTTKSESITLADLLTAGAQVAREIAEALDLTEATTKRAGPVIAEAITPTEVVTSLTGYIRLLAETFGFTEAVVKDAAKSLPLETASMAEDVLTMANKAVAESLSAADATSKQPGPVKTESLTLSEMAETLFAMEREFNDALSFAEAAIKQAQPMRSESIGLTEAVDRLLTYLRTFDETAGLTEAVTKQPQTLKSESLDMTEAVSPTPMKLITESLSAADAKVLAIFKNINLTLNLADSLNNAGDILVTISDSLNLVEAVTVAMTYVRVHADTMGLTEVLLRLIDLLKLETAAMTEAVVKDATTTLTETAGLTEIVAKQTSRTRLDVVSLDEANTKTPGPVANESIGFADALTRATDKVVAYTVGLIELLAKDVTRSRSETMSMDEAVTKMPLLTFAEAIAFTETLTKTADKVITATVNLVESVVKDVSHSLADAATMAETVTKTPNKVSSDTLALSEAFSRVFEAQRTIAESVALLESVLKDSFLVKDDSMTLTDSISDAIDLVITLLESLGLSDAVIKLAAIVYDDDLGPLDTLQLTSDFVRTLDEELATAESWFKTAGVVRDDLANITEAITKSLAITRLDVADVTDALTRIHDAFRTLQDAASMTDARQMDVQRAIEEAMTVADAGVRQFIRAIAESLGLVEATEKEAAPTRLDTLSIAEAWITGPHDMVRALADALGISDERQASVVKTLTDVVAIADEILNQPSKLLLDAIGFFDSPLKMAGKLLAEQLNPTEQITKNIGVVRSDSMEFFEFVLFLDFNFNELLAMTDAIFLTHGVVFTDSLGIQDNVTVQELRRILFRAMERLGFFRAALRLTSREAGVRKKLFRATGQRADASAAQPHTVFFRANKR